MTGPCLRLALGSDRPPAPVAKPSEMSGIYGRSGRAIRVIPFQTAWGSARRLEEGTDQSRTDGPVYQLRGSRDHYLGHPPRAVRDGRSATLVARHP